MKTSRITQKITEPDKILPTPFETISKDKGANLNDLNTSADDLLAHDLGATHTIFTK